jgi:hypothetical protein
MDSHHSTLPTVATHTMVWEEDDVYYPDKEELADAWKRIFGEDPPRFKLEWNPNFHDLWWAIIYFGDCTLFELNDGRIAVSTYDVDQIWVPNDWQVKGLTWSLKDKKSLG